MCKVSILTVHLFQYKGHAFKIPEPLRWSVVITGPKLIDELRKVPADVLDMHEAGKEVSLVCFSNEFLCDVE